MSADHSPRPKLPTRGLVLAGGRSRRFGSDKALHRTSEHGPTWLELAHDALAPWVDEVIVVRSQPLPEELGMESWADPDPGAGPALALLAAFSALPVERWWLVAPCDVPGLRAEHFAALVPWLDRFAAACFQDQRSLQPLVAGYTPRAARAMGEASAGVHSPALRPLVQSLGPQRLKVLEIEDDGLLDRNRPPSANEQEPPA